LSGRAVRAHQTANSAAVMPKMRLLAIMRDRIDISSMALSALSAKGCAHAHSMPKIHIYLSSDERKYHST